MAFRIEMFYAGKWGDDPDLVNHSQQEENFFEDDLDALAVIDDLVGVGFIRERLRIVAIDD
jgi:hypothetical protein